ncbi:hypothetical protein SAMN00808754_1786 [Thermanaeromonas toyohensis ToBE]|uniref:Uncharacterized protein n=1 Tax=Thermanaeromonas toyohensis ToBE TaxID=698762 RepID=A0A1W1VWE7_9FIRM|nr:hypothetical protein [Thermanaeromonas toyohensis]SMB97204.1 hypothetical protein SAMN00808754_1786 [Thermanaeromonas toyohensis ToBE]
MAEPGACLVNYIAFANIIPEVPKEEGTIDLMRRQPGPLSLGRG